MEKMRKVGPFSHKDSANNAALYWRNKTYVVVGPRKTSEGWFIYIKYYPLRSK